MKGWVTAQLHHSEEKISTKILIASLRSVLKNCEVFIPSLSYTDKRGEYNYSLFDGYVFVRGKFSNAQYLRLNHSTYIYKVLTSTKGNPVYTPDAEIVRMRAMLQAMVPDVFKEGDAVHIYRGVFSGLEGKVMGVGPEKLLIEVYMPLGSLIKLTKIPKIFVRL